MLHVPHALHFELSAFCSYKNRMRNTNCHQQKKQKQHKMVIECFDMDKQTHTQAGTRAYMYHNTQFTAITDKHLLPYILGSKVKHQHIIVSETQNGYWVTPLSSIGHAPEPTTNTSNKWNNDDTSKWNNDITVPFAKQYTGNDTIQVCKKLCRPCHLFFYVSKPKLKEHNICKYAFDTAPNCKIVCLQQKPPKRDPPAL